MSSAGDSTYIESEDGKQRIYGNRDVRTLSSAPGTYGPWTDGGGGTRTDLQVKLVDPNVPTYVWANSTLSFFSLAFNSLEEAETATEFVEAIPNRGANWTRTYTPGPESWVKEGELALKSDISSIVDSIDKHYIESEDKKQRIYGNGDVSTLSSAPGTYGPWTDEEGNVDNEWRVVEISAGVFCYIHGDDASYRSNDTWSSRKEAENATTFETNYGNVWTRTSTPGP